MKKDKRSRSTEAPAQTSAAPARPAGDSRVWLWIAAAAAVLIALFVYSPALNGPFLFDDLGLPFTRPDDLKLDWTHYARSVRPLLYVMFWWEGHTWGQNPAPYHYINFLFHLLDSLLVFYIVKKLVRMAGREGAGVDITAAFCAAVFLLHPLQTEAVSYIASRSENMSVLFTYGAIALYLWRKPQPAGWLLVLAVLALNALGVLTKEHAVVAPAVLLLADLFFDSVKRNWRFYALCVLGGAGALYFVFHLLTSNTTAGFGIKEFTWYQYFFTQWRALWVYLGLFVMPVGQNIDYQFPLSRSITEHGAVLALLGLLAVTAALVYYRKRFPLACFGWLAFLAMIAPTSSVVPIADALAERRLYLPFLGLLLMLAEVVLRLADTRLNRAVLAVAVILLSVLTLQRNAVYASSIAMWQDSVKNNPHNTRAWFQLGYAHYTAGQCAEASAAYERIPPLKEPDYELLVDWALALECANQPALAVQKVERAIALRPTAHAYSVLGMIRAKQGQTDLALDALNEALRRNPRFEMAHVYRGNVYVMLGNQASACADFKAALAQDPSNAGARQGLNTLGNACPR